MSIAELGGFGGPAAEWAELNGIRLPVQRDGAGKGQIQLRPMAPFPPSGSLGDATRPPLDPRLASVTLISDLTGGLGVRDLDESQGITTYKRGLLDTRFKNGVTMPPYATLLASLSYSNPNAVPTRVSYAHISGISDFIYVWGWGQAAPSLNILNPHLGYAVTNVAITPNSFAQFNGLVVFACNTTGGIQYSSNGTTFAAGDPSLFWHGLAVMDNLLWSFKDDNHTLYACTDPTQAIGVGGGWVAQGQAAIFGPDEHAHELVVWRDRSGDPALYLITDQRILGFDRASGQWTIFDDFRKRAQPTMPLGHVWQRDLQFYLTYRGTSGFANQWVMQFTGNVNEVGPTGKGGLDTDLFVQPLFVEGNQHWLFAWFAGNGSTIPGGVWAMNEFGGWHPIFDGTQFGETGQVVGGGVYGDTVYALYANGHLYAITVPDTALPPYRLSNNTRAGAATLTTGRTTCGRPNQWKIGQYFYVDCERVDGTHGLPVGSSVQVAYALEGATTFSAPVTLNNLTAFPAFIPLPDAGEAGVAFRQFTAQATLNKTNTGDEPPILRELTLYHSPWTEQKYGYVFNVDLRRETWGDGPLTDFDGLTVQQLWDKIFDRATGLANSKAHFSFAYGGRDWAVTIPAVDLLAAATTDPGAGGGVVQITLRDLSLPSG